MGREKKTHHRSDLILRFEKSILRFEKSTREVCPENEEAPDESGLRQTGSMAGDHLGDREDPVVQI